MLNYCLKATRVAIPEIERIDAAVLFNFPVPPSRGMVIRQNGEVTFSASMSKQLKEIDPELAAWIGAQRIFFVATAPLSRSGHINASPKGGEAFRILGPNEVAYQDYTGSGAETIAHLRENGRIVVMFCAFDGPPKIVRLHGTGRVVTNEAKDFSILARLFAENPGTRAIVHIVINRVSSSCGYSVPLYEFRGQRAALDEWAIAKGPDKLAAYRAEKNAKSIDGLPALEIAL